MRYDWVTNDPQAARKLKRIDRKYEQAREAAKSLPLAEKVEAFRLAKANRAKAMDNLQVWSGEKQ